MRERESEVHGDPFCGAFVAVNRNFLVGWMELLCRRRGEGGHTACAYGGDPLRGTQ